jgi:hypothetical protein
MRRFTLCASFAVLGAAVLSGCPNTPLETLAGALGDGFAALDANRNGTLNFNECIPAGGLTAAAFAEIDRDHNGELTRTEVNLAEAAPDANIAGAWKATEIIEDATEAHVTLVLEGRRFTFHFGSRINDSGARSAEYALSGRFSVRKFKEPRWLDLDFDALEFDTDRFRSDFRPDAEAIYADFTPEQLEAAIDNAGVDDYDALIDYTLDGFIAAIRPHLQERLDAMVAISPLLGIYAWTDTQFAICVPGLFGLSELRDGRPDSFGDETWQFDRVTE